MRKESLIEYRSVAVEVRNQQVHWPMGMEFRTTNADSNRSMVERDWKYNIILIYSKFNGKIRIR